MIRFVLQRPREVAGAFDDDRIAIHVLTGRDDPLRALVLFGEFHDAPELVFHILHRGHLVVALAPRPDDEVPGVGREETGHAAGEELHGPAGLDLVEVRAPGPQGPPGERCGGEKADDLVAHGLASRMNGHFHTDPHPA